MNVNARARTMHISLWGPSLQFSNLSSASRTSGSRAKQNQPRAPASSEPMSMGILTAQARPSGHDARRRPCVRRRRDFRGGVGVVIGARALASLALAAPVPTCRRVTTTTRSPRRARTLVKGRRWRQEDRASCTVLRGACASPPSELRWAAVFDGHDGDDAAELAATRLHAMVDEALTRTRRDACAIDDRVAERAMRRPSRASTPNSSPRDAPAAPHSPQRSSAARARGSPTSAMRASYRARDETPFDSTLVPPPLPQSSRLDPRPTSAPSSLATTPPTTPPSARASSQPGAGSDPRVPPVAAAPG